MRRDWKACLDRRSGARLAGVVMLGAGMLLWTACLFRLPETRYYLLEPPPLASTGPSLSIHVGFEGVQMSQLYAQEPIAYRDSTYRIQFYHYRQWAGAPDLMVGEAVLKLLRDSGRFQSVEPAPWTSTPNLVVSGRLREIYEDEREEPWKAVLTVDWDIRDGATDNVLARLTTAEKVPSADHSTEAIAAAMSRAAQATAEQLAEAIAQAAVKRPGASS